MTNRETKLARKYHQSTKHSRTSLQSTRHFLDWENEPIKYKLYLDQELVPLPRALPERGVPTMEVLVHESREGEAIPDLEQVAYLLYYAAGVTKKLRYDGGEINFRAAASAGALYPIEIYLVCRDLPGLHAGIYHFSPLKYGLHRLRQGDYQAYLVNASGDEPAVMNAPLTFVFTGLTWRTAWKYQARSYRYHYWDCGALLANALAAASAWDLPAKVIMGFVDEQVNHLIGIDGQQEKSLCLLPVGRSYPLDSGEIAWHELEKLDLEVLPLSNTRREYPLIEETHEGSILSDGDEVRRWRAEELSWHIPESAGQLFPLEPLDGEALPPESLEKAIMKRGSSRRFSREAISFVELSTLLVRATAPFPACWLDPGGGLVNELYLSVHAVGGLPSGAYIYHRDRQALELLERGDFRGEAAHLCLGQDLGGDSSATVFMLADLEAVFEVWGNRGYRLVQMEAGILGGRLYLGSYTMGRGASGLTFFDDEIVRFFSPHASGLESIFVVALGVPRSSVSRRGRMVRLSPGEQVDLRS